MSSKRPVVAARMAEFARYVAQALESKPAEMTKTKVVSRAATHFKISHGTAWRWLQFADPTETRTPKQAAQALKSEQTRVKALAQRLIKFGLTESDYHQKLNAQGGGCAICGLEPGKRSLAVDHNHQTGQVRGLLCVLCNFSIARESPELLRKAADYLESWSNVP